MYIWSHLKDAHDPAVAAHVGYEPNLLRGPLIVLPRYEDSGESSAGHVLVRETEAATCRRGLRVQGSGFRVQGLGFRV